MDYVANICAVYNMATPEEVHDGIVWYVNAQFEAVRLAQEHDIPVTTVVGVIAALSPNNRWTRNLTDAERLISAFLDGQPVESVVVSTYHKMREKAWKLLEDRLWRDEDICRHLRGQKITSFYQNIMGEDTCTIDGHAYNIAMGSRQHLNSNATNISVGLYRELQGAYAEAARKFRVNGRSLKAFELQAITWVAWRRIHGTK